MKMKKLSEINSDTDKFKTFLSESIKNKEMIEEELKKILKEIRSAKNNDPKIKLTDLGKLNEDAKERLRKKYNEMKLKK